MLLLLKNQLFRNRYEINATIQLFDLCMSNF